MELQRLEWILDNMPQEREHVSTTLLGTLKLQTSCSDKTSLTPWRVIEFISRVPPQFFWSLW